jgi:hypothetical protein
LSLDIFQEEGGWGTFVHLFGTVVTVTVVIVILAMRAFF